MRPDAEFDRAIKGTVNIVQALQTAVVFGSFLR
jgi:hypothetical protein